MMRDMGPKSDVWSLGCILVRLLAFGIGGASELKKFDTKLHQSDDGSGRHQQNRVYLVDPLRLNTHVETWLQELPTHKDTQLPLEACECLRDLLFQMLQIDMAKRLKSWRVEAELLGIRELLRPPLASELGVPSEPSRIFTSGSSSATCEGSISTTSIVNIIRGGV
ncbi:hypothetical protein BJY01DRAFT_207066 [Aspergillus pseudoustus]|uniref:Protein kinase domain-containing protein n=1 Tax=Aspergillus pseudoustus TaxID=1810923 RepID=A0ABR4KLR0_9EURO